MIHSVQGSNLILEDLPFQMCLLKELPILASNVVFYVKYHSAETLR